MNTQFSQPSPSDTYTNQTYQQEFIQPTTHIASTVINRQPQRFTIKHLQSITPIGQQQTHDRVALNKLKQIDLRFKEEKQKQNWLMKHRNKMRNIEQNLENRNKLANYVREFNILTSMQKKAEVEKRQKLQRDQTLNKYQYSSEKVQRCRNRAYLKKNQYIFKIHNKTTEKFEGVKKRKEIALKREIEQSKKVHLQQWYNYRNGLIRKYHGKELRDPTHLYEQFKIHKNHLKTMIQSINRQPQQQNLIQTSTKSKKSLTKILMPKFMPNKLASFGITSQNNLQRSKKDIQKMRIFIQQQSYSQNENQSLLNKFKSFIIDTIL